MIPTLSDLYGARSIARNYTGVRYNWPIVNRVWQHGWVFEPNDFSLVKIAGYRVVPKPSVFLTARTAESKIAARFGFVSNPIGHPYAYLPDDLSDHKHDQILVVPDRMDVLQRTEYRDSDRKFLDEASEFSIGFRFKKVLLGGADWMNSGLREVWTRRGFTPVQGADPLQNSALSRLKAVFSRSDCVFGHSPGSYVPMALAEGSRVAISPIYGASIRPWTNVLVEDDWVQIPNWHFRLLEKHSWLFCEPWNARKNQLFGRTELGHQHVLRPSELRKSLGWSFSGLVRGASSLVARRFSRENSNRRVDLWKLVMRQSELTRD